MNESKGWRELAQDFHRSALTETEVATLAASGYPWTELVDDFSASDRQRDKFKREGLASWAPPKACWFYVNFPWRQKDDVFKLNLWSMLQPDIRAKEVWETIRRRHVSELLFAVAVAETATNALAWKDRAPWMQMTDEEREDQCVKIAASARNLSVLLKESPAEFKSPLRFIPNDRAERIADHVMRCPFNIPLLSIPNEPQQAIVEALPDAGSLTDLLEFLARCAESNWGHEPTRYTKNDSERRKAARLFASNIAKWLRNNTVGETNLPLDIRELVNRCVEILFDVTFSPDALKTYCAESLT